MKKKLIWILIWLAVGSAYVYSMPPAPPDQLTTYDPTAPFDYTLNVYCPRTTMGPNESMDCLVLATKKGTEF